jgi:hypothetical protein
MSDNEVFSMLQSSADTNAMPPRRKGKTRPLTLSHLDARTRAVKRAHSLIALWTKMLGADVSAHVSMLMTHAAAATVIAEDLQARVLSGDPSVSVEQLTKASNIAGRAVRALRLPEAKPSVRKTGLKRLEWR